MKPIEPDTPRARKGRPWKLAIVGGGVIGLIGIALIGGLLTGLPAHWYWILQYRRPEGKFFLMLVAACLAAAVVRPLLARFGYGREIDRWQDWRETPVDPLPAKSTPSTKDPTSHRLDIRGRRWTKRSALRSRRKSPQKLRKRP